MRSIERTRLQHKLIPPSDTRARMERTRDAIHLFVKEHGPLNNVTLNQTKSLVENTQIAEFYERFRMYEYALDFYEDVLKRLSQALVFSKGRVL